VLWGEYLPNPQIEVNNSFGAVAIFCDMVEISRILRGKQCRIFIYICDINMIRMVKALFRQNVTLRRMRKFVICQ